MPTYDNTSHQLLWSILGRGSNDYDVANSNTCVLGRDRYFKLKLLTDQASVAQDTTESTKIGSMFHDNSMNIEEGIMLNVLKASHVQISSYSIS